MLVIWYEKGRRRGYVEKREGTVFLHRDPRKATTYIDRDDAERGKVGHHADMGGDGLRGRPVPLSTAIREYKRHQEIYPSRRW